MEKGQIFQNGMWQTKTFKQQQICLPTSVVLYQCLPGASGHSSPLIAFSLCISGSTACERKEIPRRCGQTDIPGKGRQTWEEDGVGFSRPPPHHRFGKEG